MYIYSYHALERDLSVLSKNPYLSFGSAGKSVENRELYTIRLGNGSQKRFINGTHHGMEWITSALLIRFCKEFSDCFRNHKPFAGYDTEQLWQCTTMTLLPMVNPDGVQKCVQNPGLRWQANANGVDLNHNYNAGWQECKKAELEAGITGPCSTRYGGIFPESEPETKAIVALSRTEQFDFSVSYHTQGEEIYYRYGSFLPPRSEQIAQAFSRVSGYRLSSPPTVASHGGYKDWFIREFQKPGFTIEAGLGKNPLPFSQLEDIYQKNKGILALSMCDETIRSLQWQKNTTQLKQEENRAFTTIGQNVKNR